MKNLAIKPFKTDYEARQFIREKGLENKYLKHSPLLSMNGYTIVGNYYIVVDKKGILQETFTRRELFNSAILRIKVAFLKAVKQWFK